MISMPLSSAPSITTAVHRPTRTSKATAGLCTTHSASAATATRGVDQRLTTVCLGSGGRVDEDTDDDDDGKTDGYEVNVAGTNPLAAEAPSVALTSGGGSPGPYLLVLLAIATLRRGKRS